MKKWSRVFVPLAVFIALITVAAPAFAGAPDEGQKKALPVGGPPPAETGELASGWVEYPTGAGTPSGSQPAPYYQGSDNSIEAWPKPVDDILAWTADRLNPAKWGADTINGALTGLMRATIGLLAQPVFWIYGRSVENPYADLEPGSASATGSRTMATGLGIVLTTPAEYTYGSLGVKVIYAYTKAVAMAFLGLALAWAALRELIRQPSRGSYHFHGTGEAIRRLTVAVVLAGAGAFWIVEQMILLNNSMIQAVVGDPLTDVLRDIVFFDQTSNLLLTAGLIVETGIALLFLLLFLFIYGGIMITRIPIIGALLLFAPFAGMSYATEETSYIWNTWIRAAISVVFYQFVGALVLKLAGQLIGNAWAGLTAGHPLLMAILSISVTFAAITVPPILGFTVGRKAGGLGGSATRIVMAGAIRGAR